MQATFKVHKVEPRGVVDGKATVEIVTLHPIDPHEPGPHDLFKTSRSGENGQIRLQVDASEALGQFVAGKRVTVTFSFEE